jgi:hypothetical protein
MVSDGQDLQPYIIERWGSGTYRLQLYRGTKVAGNTPAFEILDPNHPKQPARYGTPPATLPGPAPHLAQHGAPPGFVAASSYAAPTWTPPGQPNFVQWQEAQERQAEREEQRSEARMARIRAEDDDRRRQREREDEDRRKRDLEDMERRMAQDKARASAEIEQMKVRHALDLEKSKQEHEYKMRQLELERERDAPGSEDVARLLEEAEDRILASVKKDEAPKSEWMAFLSPHMPAITTALGGLAKAAQDMAKKSAAAAAQSPEGGGQ